eukprot:m.394921 g.394921  ORF g.394921 m.394921 type:complete len:51 (-) comp28347_c0_seq1:146-298(-)
MEQPRAAASWPVDSVEHRESPARPEPDQGWGNCVDERVQSSMGSVLIVVG